MLNKLKLSAWLRSAYTGENKYTALQKLQYKRGTSDHLEHDANPEYWDILLGDIKRQPEAWRGKYALDFACGKGRNIHNLWSLSKYFAGIDGCDISAANIEACTKRFGNTPGRFVTTNGLNSQPLETSRYDFVMSTIALQHIPVYDIRRSIISDILRVMKPNAVFSFQMGCGTTLDNPNGGLLSTYFENNYEASGTNSIHDVQIVDPNDLVSDLHDIGFVDVTYEIRPSFSDKIHENWIYVKCRKQ